MVRCTALPRVRWRSTSGNSSTDDDIPVVQNPVNLFNTSQHWAARRRVNNQFQLMNSAAGKPRSSPLCQDTGTKLVQYESHGWNDQLWTVNFGETALTVIATVLAAKVTSTSPPRPSPGTSTSNQPPNGIGGSAADNQAFIFTPLNEYVNLGSNPPRRGAPLVLGSVGEADGAAVTVAHADLSSMSPPDSREPRRLACRTGGGAGSSLYTAARQVSRCLPVPKRTMHAPAKAPRGFCDHRS